MPSCITGFAVPFSMGLRGSCTTVPSYVTRFAVGGLGFEFACSSPVEGVLFGVFGLLLL